MLSIQIDNQYYTLRQISQNENLFDKLSKLSSIRYQFHDSFYGRMQNQSGQYNFDSIDKKIKFKERIDAIKAAGKVIQKEEKELHKERLNIQSQKLSRLLKAYNLGDSKLYRGFNLSPLMDVFIRQGYIDEDYYDYISYFYPGMVSWADRDLLLSMKRQIKKEYTYHICGLSLAIPARTNIANLILLDVHFLLSFFSFLLIALFSYLKLLKFLPQITV